MQQNNFGVLRSLCGADVKFILVGALAAVLNGAPITTYDVDVVFSVDTENILSILKWLEQADAIFRMQPERRLRPNQSHVAAGRHLNLLTPFGAVDLLGFIGDQLTYPQLLPLSNEMDIGDGLCIRVLNLETIIAVKEKLASEKDLAALPVLRSTLKEIQAKRT
jgi:predicted nucleotidyltransferase